jgi:NAD(P)H-dependent FMN reductase
LPSTRTNQRMQRENRPKRIGIVVGSTRPRRICRQIAEWVLATAQTGSALTYELIDLAEVALPFLDEPSMAALGLYEHEHTKRWSALVASYDGFVFVAPQYNWGYPAVLKNALDFLYTEWSEKPAAIVSYGTRGGGRAIEQLRQVLQGLHMRGTASNPALNTNADMLDGDGRLVAIAHAFAGDVPIVRAMDRELTGLLG